MNDHINSISKLIDNNENPEEIKFLLKNFISQNISNLECKIHPLGFYFFRLSKTDDEAIIRLHIWDQTLQKQDSELEIHNHIFNMTSLILVGSLINQNYEINESNNDGGFLYEVNYVDHNSVLKKVKNNISIRLIESKKIKTNEFYSLKESIFHNTFTDKYVATILKTDINTNKNPLLYSKIDFEDLQLEFKRDVVNNNKKERILNHFISRI
jgi:hypothetical protein